MFEILAARIGPYASIALALYLAWRQPGAIEDTRRAHMRRLAYATRYGHAGDWVWFAPSDLLQEYVEALAEIVEEENRPRE